MRQYERVDVEIEVVKACPDALAPLDGTRHYRDGYRNARCRGCQEDLVRVVVGTWLGGGPINHVDEYVDVDVNGTRYDLNLTASGVYK